MSICQSEEEAQQIPFFALAMFYKITLYLCADSKLILSFHHEDDLQKTETAETAAPRVQLAVSLHLLRTEHAG